MREAAAQVLRRARVIVDTSPSRMAALFEAAGATSPPAAETATVPELDVSVDTSALFLSQEVLDRLFGKGKFAIEVVDMCRDEVTFPKG